ncbi:MAG: DUF4280 domain-containing protein [Cellulomonas sp.]|uniref:DUF4280 domain-containing protein n=1 Tax=Cellulomonas gelida TaxID=1712 RepID=A0A4Y3KM60_9CELL|nr:MULTISPECIES: DUF4280 domain-containing protein [Cellulomonas]KMM45685.1 hypothetical protein CWIS_09345 [Cellulomonas sp. A375-1]MCR6649659.1 DUF4280 domain-containing protein [Cellulomonas sp.]MCR6705634.1 DUF4280 domain-containing protein [Cellulomonas sp.]GEA85067.1 hypothetical protein CGE01nite_23180 [Cellulomonas gelida]GGL16343.1 hypothetical protein GCM10009774_03460 [Cellulomonas gelida]
MSKPAATSTALTMCSFGLAPASLNVLPTSGVLIEGKPAATITDSAPMVNVPPFGMCTSLANPTVAAATAAALGVLTPMPCIPATTPWVNGATQTVIGGRPALTLGAQCMCAYGGVIQILNPGSMRTLEG